MPAADLSGEFKLMVVLAVSLVVVTLAVAGLNRTYESQPRTFMYRRGMLIEAISGVISALGAFAACAYLLLTRTEPIIGSGVVGLIGLIGLFRAQYALIQHGKRESWVKVLQDEHLLGRMALTGIAVIAIVIAAATVTTMMLAE